MRTSRWPSAPLPGASGFALGFATGLVLVAVATATGLRDSPAGSLIAFAALVAGISAVTTARAALANMVVCWALYASFVIGYEGDLVINTQSVFAAEVLGLTAIVSASAFHWGVRPRPSQRAPRGGAAYRVRHGGELPG